MLTAFLIVFATSPSEPLTWKIAVALTGGGLVGAMITGILKWKELRDQVGQIDTKINGQLKADLTKLEVEMEARLRAETRTQVARLRESYVNALPFHATLLRDHMSSVGDKLSNSESRQKMKDWFEEIKEYGRHDRERNEAMGFSAKLHYPMIFPMSTLYYTSVFFLFSQRIRTLAPFTEADSQFSDGLDEHLRNVENAFARKDAKTDAAREAELNGLWETVQNNMGAIVRKGDGYLSYPEFCTLFIDTSQPMRNDHVFMRALDFFGAGPGPLLNSDGARSIADALDALVKFLRKQRTARELEERERKPTNNAKK